jgi:replicative DNA helicase
VENNLSLQPFQLFIENEQKYLAYLFKQDSQDSLIFDSKYFLNKELKIIFESIQTLCIEGVKIDIDIVFDSVKQKTQKVEIADLQLIISSYNDFENIDRVKNRIKENYLKQVSTKQILENILRETTDSGDLNIAKVKGFRDSLSDVLFEVEDEKKSLLSFGDIISEKYLQVLEDREQGRNKKTLGLRYLDKAIKYAGEPGDITTVAMRTGTGKTTVGLNIANALINKGIPVFYLCFDMGYVTVMDRFLCIRGGFSNNELLLTEKEDSLKSKILIELDRLEKIKNFLVYPEGTLSLKEFEAFIPKVKKILSNDYFVCIFDTIDMLSDFSGADPYKIKEGINKLSTILKKNNLHAINLNQLNENQIRAKKPKRIEDVDFIKFTKEDIEGGASYSHRSRAVIIGVRPKEMKKSFFPEEKELLELEEDVLILTIDKQNDGDTGRIPSRLIFDPHTFRIYENID